MNSLERRYKQTSSNGMKEYYESFMRQIPCTTCHGARLKKESLAVTIDGKNISDISDMTIVEAGKFVDSVEFSTKIRLSLNQ